MRLTGSYELLPRRAGSPTGGQLYAALNILPKADAISSILRAKRLTCASSSSTTSWPLGIAAAASLAILSGTLTSSPPCQSTNIPP
ncbi:hypothetical protein CMUS01_10402 [Colletotrichum musicola]|uniref:Uncharacterized protein n=1 Tax=Colletotrichum musicola TaxID=2175873 RepID=A0A8H6N8C8_9PEZI|nr:hypothetical protein CMUS01_10402 [Colletotrichum musicola]